MAAPLERPRQSGSWVDVTALLDSVSDALSPGQVLLNQDSSLLEVMSAVEVMDAKMDSGLGVTGVLTLEEAVREKLVPAASSLSNETIVAIMDQLLAAESLFFDGFSLLQTIYSCYYMHDVESIDNPFLGIFCKILLRRTLILRDCILQACISDEEDFYPYLFGFAFPSCSFLAHEISVALDDFSAGVLSLSLSLCYTVNDAFLFEQSKQLEAEAQKSGASAMFSRLNANRLMLEAHLQLVRKTKQAVLSKEVFRSAVSLFSSITTQLDIIGSSHIDSPDILRQIFNSELWKRFATTAPPRPLHWPQFGDSLSRLQRQAAMMCEISEKLTSCTSLHLLFGMCANIVSRGADLVCRAQFFNASMQDMRIASHDGVPLTDWIQQELTYFGVPKSSITPECREFLIYGARGAVRRMRTLLCNRSRSRRRLVHCFEDSSILISDGEAIDERQMPPASRGVEEGPKFLARWATDWTIDEMQLWLFAGFELQLYENYEFPLIWWYLDSLAAHRLHGQLAILKHNEMQRLKLKALRDRRNPKSQPPPSAPTPTLQSTALEAEHNIIRGIVFSLALFTSEHLIESEPVGALSSAESRYYRRLMPFLRIPSPGMMNFKTFQKSFLDDLVKVPAAELTKKALHHFTEAQAALGKLLRWSPSISSNQMDEYKKMLRVAITNGVKVGTLKRGVSGSIRFDFSVHVHYPIFEFNQQ